MGLSDLVEKIYSFFKNMFEKKPIDYNKGKYDETQYFNEKLPNISENMIDQKFVDPYFPHDINAIVNDWNPFLNRKIIEDKREDVKKEYKEKFENGTLHWERISNVLKKINIEKSLKKGIAQGYLGDCYLIAFLRGYLKFQKKQFYKILGKCHPEIGYYEVNFFYNNKNIVVFVDDFIILNENDLPLFSCPKEDNKYTLGIALIIEKAFAKLNGSYLNIEGHNLPYSAYYHFTGLPSYAFYINSFKDDMLYDEVKEYINNKNVVVCGTKNIKEGEKFPIKGVSENHAYTVFGLQKKNNEKIIHLNNPWGFNYEDDMKDFDIKLNDTDVKNYIKDFNLEKKNLNNGDLKIDIKSLIDNWQRITFIPLKKDEKKKTKTVIKKPLPEGVPPDGMDGDDIDKIIRDRIGILDYIEVDRNLQNEFLEMFENCPEIGIFFLFLVFMNYGTSKDNFMILMKGLKNNFNTHSNNTQMNQNEFSIPQFKNYTFKHYK